ncbi:hypothetical protein DMN91_008451 [Ooceraea biroi]|uniref:Cytokine receptor n=1 Tax=Ooceraea biroi TaxID=2015173 RepID=A0A026WCE1_OOCBI|nr:uncharacterized protein LOC105280778 [Ooceraea biroi]XP_011339876.1 uncharacterized protein LOC105280778 [Ooceraea biroi]XP_026827669.1 uncharacterized protein LOC105280778 [Ooceraea biroi]EZA53737.1 Cytokine receptor [Ooceraea biroi]RLU19892.1 hypothetical protein DMN91_008451 [Ooceraea biroi]
MSSSCARSETPLEKMDQDHRSNATFKRIRSLGFTLVRLPLPIHSTCATISNNYDASKTEGAVPSEENVTTQEVESHETTRLTRDISSSLSACPDSRSSPCKENDCSTCNCSIMNWRNEDTARNSDARRHSCSTGAESTRKHDFDGVYLPLGSRTNCLESKGWAIFFLLISYLLCTTLCTAMNDCAAGLITAGKTWPRGDIVIQRGNPLRIYCMLNQTYVDLHLPGKNSSDLAFFRNKRKLGRHFVSIVNETTIVLNIQEPPPSDNMYYCKLRLGEYGETNRAYEAVCLNKVVVGDGPPKPVNFTCVSYNWENMTCSWVPEKNFLHTTFTLMFRLPGRTGGRKLFPCPKEFPKPLPEHTCVWDATTNPIYRQPYETYTFYLNVHNFLGNATYTYKINHYANVIPAQPDGLRVGNKTLDSVMLHWNVPFPMQTFPPGLHHRIMYENQWDREKSWKVINITYEPRVSKRSYNLSDLEYANTVYDVRVFMKSAVANDNMWSKFSHVTFRTLPRLPGSPPRTDIGSFEIAENNANRDIYLYWQAIPEYRENGNNFKYQIVRVEESGRVIDNIQIFKPSETTRTYAKFKGISFNSYAFEIVSTNEIGANEKRAKIFVPSKREMPPEPVAFTKIAFEGGLYELSWKPPLENKDITNYTIFWCDNERDRPYQCTGYLDWVQVSKDTTIYNMTVPNPDKVYQFAISANTAKGSSGMIWASCTVIHNKVVGKMKSVWINRIGSDFIEVGWKLDCSDRIGIVEGFNIYYCPILSPFNLNCKGPKLNRTIKADPRMIHGIVDNLMPYTTYMLAVAVLTKSGEGLHSDPLYNTTLEAAPTTSPMDVKITNVTNTTMFITWKSPAAMNGVLRYYEIYYNDQAKKAEENTHVELTNLAPYQRYNISVAACTVACSAKSPVEVQYTHIGVPGKSNVPTVRFMNSSQVLVTWETPQNAAGPVDHMYYEIETNDGEIRNTTSLKIQLPIPDCKVGREGQYRFRVRAVNVANGVHLKGPWSDPGEGNCYSDGPSFRAMIFIWLASVLAVISFLLFSFYASKKLWLKCRAMRDVEVKLPPGLQPDMKLLQKGNEQHTRQSSADSSGCSSGQESVTSSLTAESQVSSDSGTEVNLVSPEKVLEDTLIAPTTWEAGQRLRQRNNTSIAQTDVAKTAGSHDWNLYKGNKSGEPVETASLARSTPNLTDSIGCTTSPHTWSSTGYISMPSSEELSSNPSPVPRENANNVANTGNVAGRYCVIGGKPEDDNGISAMSDSNDEANDALIPAERETTSMANPYVSLASLEQKQKEKEKENQQAVVSLRDLNQLNSLVDPGNNKFNLNALAPGFTLPENTTARQEPYVQTGLMNALHKTLASNPVEQSAKGDAPKCDSFASTSLTDSRSKPYVSSFMVLGASTSLPEAILNTSTKPSVATPQIAELPQSSIHAAEKKESLPQKGEPHSPSRIPASSEKSPNPSYIFASPILRMLQKQYQKQQRKKEQQQQKQKPSASVMEEKKNDDKDNASCPALSCGAESGREAAAAARLNPARMPIITRQKSGYVTIAENPDAPSATTGQSDEQYSKMTVAPSTVQ